MPFDSTLQRASLLLLGASALWGQSGAALSPQEAVEEAVRSHPALAAFRARVDAAEGERQQAGLRPNPRLFLQSENARLPFGAHPLRFSYDTDTFAYASQVFEAPGKRSSRVAFAQEGIERRRLEESARRTEIAYNVLNSYWAAVGAERVRTVLQENLANLEQTVQYHRDRVREGAIAEVDLIRVDLEKEQVAVQFRNADQDVRRLRLQLFRDMGQAEDPGVKLTGNLEDVQPLITPSIDEALNRRPDLRLARQNIEQAQSLYRLEQANAKPDPEVLFGYKRTLGLNTAIVGLQINLPFRNRNQGAIAAAAAGQRAAAHESESATLAARNVIASAQSDFDQKLALLHNEIPRIRAHAADTTRIARAVYREGAGDLLRLLDAERAGLQSDLLYVRTLIDYHFALTHLQAVTGMLP